MIPKPHIAEWKDHAPWISMDDVEQDLIICRAMIDIFNHDFLKENLAFRGGTALHKLYLDPAPRYSEDIDLVQINPGPIKPILDALAESITFFEEDRVIKPKANNNTILYRFNAEYSNIRLRLKVEINCREHFTVDGWKKYPFEISNPWFSGKAEITTYDLNELLGTKLRALYQRRKGRDLFDLYYVSQHSELDLDKLIACYHRYMEFSVDKPPTAKQFLQNLEQKEQDKDFFG